MPLTDAELTKRAAEGVMGFLDLNGLSTDYPYPVFFDTVDGLSVVRKQGDCGRPWNPLTDWRAAGEIVEKILADGWEYETTTVARYYTSCFFRTHNNEEQFESHCDRAYPRATTIAALLACQLVAEAEL